MGGESRNLGQSADGHQGFVHAPLVDFVGDHDDFCSGGAGVELHDGLDRDVAIAEAAADASDHTRCILCVETDVVPLADSPRVNQAAPPPAAGRQQRIQPSVCTAGLPDPGDVENVGDYC